MSTKKEQQLQCFANKYEYPLMGCGMPEENVSLDGQSTPIQCVGRRYRLDALSWASGEGWGEFETVIEDDGTIGTITWRDGEPESIDWRDLTREEWDEAEALEEEESTIQTVYVARYYDESYSISADFSKPSDLVLWDTLEDKSITQWKTCGKTVGFFDGSPQAAMKFQLEYVEQKRSDLPDCLDPGDSNNQEAIDAINESVKTMRKQRPLLGSE